MTCTRDMPEPVGPAVALSADPSTVTFAADDVSRRDGQTLYLSGCAEGTVELRRPSDGAVLRTCTFEVTASSADLVVGSVSVSDSTLTPGQSFTLSATVRNQGTGAAEATTLRYYRS